MGHSGSTIPQENFVVKWQMLHQATAAAGGGRKRGAKLRGGSGCSAPLVTVREQQPQVENAQGTKGTGGSETKGGRVYKGGGGGKSALPPRPSGEGGAVLHYYRSTVPVSECNNSYEECGARRPCGHWETARLWGIKGGVKQRLRFTSGLGGLKNVVL